MPAADEKGLRRWFDFEDFPQFVEVFVTIAGCLKTAADYELAVVDLVAELAGQNVRYGEVTFSPGTAEYFGVASDTYLGGLSRGRE